MLIRDICENLNSSMRILSSGSSEVSKTKWYILHHKNWELIVFLPCVQQGQVTPTSLSFSFSSMHECYLN